MRNLMTHRRAAMGAMFPTAAVLLSTGLMGSCVESIDNWDSESSAKCATHPDCVVGMAHEKPHNPQ